VGDLLQLALPVLMAGLQDKDDSVQAAAAEALVPLAPLLLQMQAEDVSSPALVDASALHPQSVAKLGSTAAMKLAANVMVSAIRQICSMGICHLDCPMCLCCHAQIFC
jgi:hypothetical protein